MRRPPISTLFPYTTLFRSFPVRIAHPDMLGWASDHVSGFPARYPGSKPLTWSERSEEHTSELQSQSNLVCRLLLEKKNNKSLRSQANTKASWRPEVKLSCS